VLLLEAVLVLARAMTWLMSTSLKVVSWAAVFCDSLRRSAMVLRSRAHRTRSSRSACGRGPEATGDGRRALRGAGFERGQHVAFRHAAILAAAVHRGRAQAGLLGDAAHAGHYGRVGFRRLRDRLRPGFWASTGLATSRFRCRGYRRAGVTGFAFRDGTEDRAHLNRRAFLHRDRLQRAVGRRRHFDGHLVGFEFEQRLVARDGIAFLLEPARDGRFRHRFTHRGDLDVDAHSVNASLRNAFNSAACWLASPAAVEAYSGRPT
jgi:hypothetical protein